MLVWKKKKWFSYLVFDVHFHNMLFKIDITWLSP